MGCVLWFVKGRPREVSLPHDSRACGSGKRIVRQGVAGRKRAERAGRTQLTSERSLTWSVQAPENNEIVAGRWWPEDNTEAEVSLELDYAEDFSLSLGDRMEFDVGGKKVWATVTSIRSLEWESMTPNFFIILSPGALQGFPATYMTSFFLGAQREGVFEHLVEPVPDDNGD